MGLHPLDDLPRKTATEAKNRWSEVVQAARDSGAVAVTSHDRIETVVVSASLYREIVSALESKSRSDAQTLDELTAEFDAHLESLNEPGTHAKMDRVLAARGRVKARPKAGKTF